MATGKIERAVIGTIVSNSVVEESIEFNNNTQEICNISLPAGTWVINADIRFVGATVGQRLGATISNTNESGRFNSWAYTLISVNSTQNHYINVSHIANISETTTYYLMGFSDGTRTVDGRIIAVRIK